MDVLRHPDKGNQIELLEFDGSVDCFTEHRSPDIVRQERHLPVAGKRQFMDTPLLLEMPDALSVFLPVLHGRHLV